MKKYVGKYAVMAPRGKINSTATEPNQSQIQHGREEAKPLHLEPKCLEQVKSRGTEVERERSECASSHTSQQPESCHFKMPSVVKMKEQNNLEQVKSRRTGVECERSECASCHKSQQPEGCRCNLPSVVKMRSERQVERREKAYSASEEGRCWEKTTGCPVAAIRKERRTESVSCVENWNRQHGSEKSLVRPGIIKKPAESSVANSIRMSILKEHQKQRRCSADSGAQPVNVEINSNHDETKARCKTRSERSYSDVTGSSKCATGTKKDCIQDKTKQRKFIGVRELKIKPKISQKSTENKSCRKKSLSKDEVSRGQRRSCSVLTHVRNERNRKTSAVERKNTARLLVFDKDDSHSSDIDSTDSDEDDVMANITTQPRSHNVTNMKSPYDKDCTSIKSRDRTVSTPCGVVEARARRRVARESLNYHMYHCRRLRAKSTKSTSSERLDKENVSIL